MVDLSISDKIEQAGMCIPFYLNQFIVSIDVKSFHSLSRKDQSSSQSIEKESDVTVDELRCQEDERKKKRVCMSVHASNTSFYNELRRRTMTATIKRKMKEKEKKKKKYVCVWMFGSLFSDFSYLFVPVKSV